MRQQQQQFIHTITPMATQHMKSKDYADLQFEHDKMCDGIDNLKRTILNALETHNFSVATIITYPTMETAHARVEEIQSIIENIDAAILHADDDDDDDAITHLQKERDHLLKEEEALINAININPAAHGDISPNVFSEKMANIRAMQATLASMQAQLAILKQQLDVLDD